jgi:hypothetical protein
VYRDRSDEEIRDISIVRFEKGAWSEPKSIFDDSWKIAGCPVNGPRADSKGNHLAIAWFTAAEGMARVNFIYSNDGGATFNQPVRLDEAGAIGRVDVTILDENASAVSWMEGSEIKVVKIEHNGKKGIPFTIASSSESRSSGFPQMTKSGNELIFAWTDDREKKIKVGSVEISNL